MKKIIILILTLFLFSTKLAASSATLSVSCPSTADPNEIITCTISVNPTDLNMGGIQIKHTFTNSTYSSFTINSSIYNLHKEDTTNMVLAQVSDKTGISSSHKIGTLKVKIGSSGTSTIKFSEIAISKTASEGYEEIDVPSVTKTIRIRSNVSTLDSLSIDKGTLSPSFSSTTYNYTANVDSSSVVITARSNNNATITGDTGSKTLSYGENTFTINVKSEDGSKTSTYKIVITRTDNRDKTNTLKSLTVSTGTLSPSFSSNTTSYTVDVGSNINEITLSASATSTKASVSGTGTKTLSGGSNTFKIIVTSEAQTTKTYTIVVNKVKDKTNTLSSLTVSGGTLSPSFSSGVTNYTTTINSTSTKISATATSSKSTITGDIGTKNLNYGKNTFEIYVTSESGEKRTYTIVVNREDTRDATATLKSLTISAGTLSPSFSTNITDYTVSVKTSSITINATATSTKATVSGAGTHSLKYGTNTINVTVTAEKGNQKVYTIVITRIDERDGTNTLKSLTVSEGELSPTFSPTRNSYSVSVTSSTITINATKTSDKSTMTGTGTKSLSYGENTFKIVVTSEKETTNTYTIIVNRIDNRDTTDTLDSITLSKGTLSPVFNKNTLKYTTTVSEDTGSIKIDAKATSSKATISGTGTKTLERGENTFKIVVTSEKGNKKTYTIVVNRVDTRDETNTLNSITINKGTLSPVFNKNTLNYTVDVDENVDSITIDVVKTSTKSKILEGTGTHSLKLGKNTIEIVVQSEKETKRTYTIIVTREDKRESINTLNSINVSVGSLNPVFHKETTKYIVKVNEVVTSIKIDATLTSNKSSFVEGYGPKTINNLKFGENIVLIKVKAENETIKTYEIIVRRTDSRSSNNYLKELNITNTKIDFRKNTTEYSLVVPNNVNEVTVTANVEDLKSKLTGTGKYKLKEGANTIIVEVKAENETIRKYTIQITRISDNVNNEHVSNKLTKLEVKNYNINFESSIREYSLEIGDETELDISFIPETKSSSVLVVGNKELINGSVVKVIVTSIDGNQNEYNINIIKKETQEPTTEEPKNKFELPIPMPLAIVIGLFFAVVLWPKRTRR